MKNNPISLLILLFFIPGYSQNLKYEYNGRRTPSIKKEKLIKAEFITEIMPELWRNILLPFRERVELDYRKKIDYSQEWYTYMNPKAYDYSKIINYVSVEMITIIDGKIVISQSTSDKLTTEQKNSLNTADLGTDIKIKIKFNYKNQINDNLGNNNRIIEGESTITVVPETEAAYPGGYKQLTIYLIAAIFNNFSEKSAVSKIQQASVYFTINEDGSIMNAKLSRMSSDSKIDACILTAIGRMPKWKPAKNAKGITVKQVFCIPFDYGGC